MKLAAVVIGAGGHAKVAIEVLEEHSDVTILGCLDAHVTSGRLLDYPILGCDHLLPELYQSGVRHALVAIGDNQARRRAALRLRDLGFVFINAISRSAFLSRRIHLGTGVVVARGVTVNVDSHIGDFAILNTGCTVDHDCWIGPYSHVAPGASLAGGVRLGEGAMLGTGSSVIPYKSIGDWTVVGAGAVVVRDLPAHTTAAGVPARLLQR